MAGSHRNYRRNSPPSACVGPGGCLPLPLPPPLPQPRPSFTVGLLPEISQAGTGDLESGGIRPLRAEANLQRVRLEGEQARIEGPMMEGTVDEAVAWVVGAILMLEPDVRSVEDREDILHTDEGLHATNQGAWPAA